MAASCITSCVSSPRSKRAPLHWRKPGPARRAGRSRTPRGLLRSDRRLVAARPQRDAGSASRKQAASLRRSRLSDTPCRGRSWRRHGRFATLRSPLRRPARTGRSRSQTVLAAVRSEIAHLARWRMRARRVIAATALLSQTSAAGRIRQAAPISPKPATFLAFLRIRRRGLPGEGRRCPAPPCGPGHPRAMPQPAGTPASPRNRAPIALKHRTFRRILACGPLEPMLQS